MSGLTWIIVLVGCAVGLTLCNAFFGQNTRYQRELRRYKHSSDGRRHTMADPASQSAASPSTPLVKRLDYLNHQPTAEEIVPTLSRASRSASPTGPGSSAKRIDSNKKDRASS